jgi:invasion associated locus B (IalB) protein
LIAFIATILPRFAAPGEYYRRLARLRCCRNGSIMTRLSLIILSIVLAAPAAAAAPAKKPAAPPARHAAPATSPTRKLGGAGAWSAYFFKEKAARVCYLVGEPKKAEPAAEKRKTPMAMVTHRPEEKVFNVVSFVEGYPLKQGSDVALDINGTKFSLFTNGDTGWARTADLDRTIVMAMAKGREATVKGTPQRGAPTTDLYSLTGFSQALALIDKACGVKR